MEIRKAQSEDIASIHKLLAMVNLIHHNLRPDLFKLSNKYTDSELLSIISQEKMTIFVALIDALVVGYAFTIVKQVKNDNLLVDRKTLYIDDLCVDAAYRGQHVGKKLYEHVLAYAKKLGCYNVTLNVWQNNDNAYKFYVRNGLTPQKTTMEKIL